MRLVNKILYLICKYFGDRYERFKGSKTLVPIPLIHHPNENYSIELENGSIIRIHCDESRYALKYTNSLISNKRISIYKVYSIITNTDDPSLISLFGNKEFVIGNLVHPLADTELQKKTAIAAYLNVIYYEKINSKK